MRKETQSGNNGKAMNSDVVSNRPEFKTLPMGKHITKEEKWGWEIREIPSYKGFPLSK